MKPTKLAFLALTLLVAAAPVCAAPADVTLPGETTKLRSSDLPGYKIAQQKCAICHSADYISYQPPAMSLAQWTAEMTKMQHSYGAPITDAEVRQLGAYLAVAYGAAKASDPDVVAVVNEPDIATTGTPAAAASVDVQAMLSQNACLSCHALTQKIVGPSYHDVAEHYKSDPQAQVKLETSIRNGSSGKWGNTAMPAFGTLKPEEIKALAEFVRRQ